MVDRWEAPMNRGGKSRLCWSLVHQNAYKTKVFYLPNAWDNGYPQDQDGPKLDHSTVKSSGSICAPEEREWGWDWDLALEWCKGQLRVGERCDLQETLQCWITKRENKTKGWDEWCGKEGREPREIQNISWDHAILSRETLLNVGWKERKGRAEMVQGLRQSKGAAPELFLYSQTMVIRKLWAKFYISSDIRMKWNESLTCTIPRGERNGANGSPKLQATLAVRSSEHGSLNLQCENFKFSEIFS